MKKIIFSLLAIIFFAHSSFSQNYRKYTKLVNEAFALHKEKEYLKSAQKYSEAFVSLKNKGMYYDRYNAACSWALAGEPDSAFVQLFSIARNANFSNYEYMNNDVDLKSLHSDKRWMEVIDIVKENKKKEEANLDKTLVVMLDTIYSEDQTYRSRLDDVEKEYGWDSPEAKSLWKIIHVKDSINLIKVCKILNERGWLGTDIIGIQGNRTLFLVIQHADFKTQTKYLPMMRDAVKKGNAAASNLALLEDRVALKQGKKQIYGSQIGINPHTGEYYVSPLEDPKNVNKRRAKVGLGKIEDYVAIWNMTWNAKEYIKKLPELEELEKNIVVK
jgi:hypothetical protein